MNLCICVLFVYLCICGSVQCTVCLCICVFSERVGSQLQLIRCKGSFPCFSHCLIKRSAFFQNGREVRSIREIEKKACFSSFPPAHYIPTQFPRHLPTTALLRATSRGYNPCFLFSKDKSSNQTANENNGQRITAKRFGWRKARALVKGC